METSWYQEVLLVFNLGANRAPSSVHHKQLWRFKKIYIYPSMMSLGSRCGWEMTDEFYGSKNKRWKVACHRTWGHSSGCESGFKTSTQSSFREEKKETNRAQTKGNGKEPKRWCHRVLVPNTFLSWGSLVSRVGFHNGFLKPSLQPIWFYDVPQDCCEQGTQPEQSLLSLLNNWVSK